MDIFLSFNCLFQQKYINMSDLLQQSGQNEYQVICETVAYRYSDEKSIMLVGEAEVSLSVMTVQDVHGHSLANMQSVRVDVLSAYNADGVDQYALVMKDAILKKAVEDAALEHYLRPPKVPIALPLRRVEW